MTGPAAADGKVYLKRPDGAIVRLPADQEQQAVDAGYAHVQPAEIQDAQDFYRRSAGEQAAVTAGVATAPEGYSQPLAAGERALGAATFGLLQPSSASARARGLRFEGEHPYKAFAADVAGTLPGLAATGAIGEAAVAGARGAGLGARVAARGLDWGANAAMGGAQIEGQQAVLQGREFSYTDAAVTGLAGEVLGRGAAAGLGAAYGGARNLLAGAERRVVAADAASSLAKGGLLNDYRVAQHAETYQNELATLAADDFDRLETSFEEVSRQDRKRARILRTVVDQPEVQGPIREQAYAELSQLRETLAEELSAPGASAPARSLQRQLDDRLAALEGAPSGRKLWRLLDENRQALQEYRTDLHQAYEDNPGAAWLSRDGLAALDGAEKSTREALLREDAWGVDAARMQAEYNVPFHEQYFPTQKTVRSKLLFSTQKNERGFDVFRGDPAKIKAFFTRDLNTVDGARLAEQLTDHLDGVSAIARAGQQDAPAAAREALEAVRRIRKAMANARYVSEAAERTGRRADVFGVMAGAAAGGVTGGPAGVAIGGAMARGGRTGDWLLRVGQRLGWGAGRAESMARLLERDALPAAGGRDRSVQSMLDDLLDSADGGGPGGPSEPPAGPGGGGPGGPGGGLTPSMAADAQRGSWTPSGAPEDAGAVTGVEDLAEPLASPAELRPSRAETAARPTRPVGAAGGEREVGRGQGEALELEGLRDQTAARRRDEARAAALTKGEFADVVGGLKSSGDPEAEAFAAELERRESELVDEGWLSEAGEPAAPELQNERTPAAPTPRLAGGLEQLRLEQEAARAEAIETTAAAREHPAAAASVAGLAEVHPLMQMPPNPDRTVKVLAEIFGDRPPTPEQWRRLLPLDSLEKLGRLGVGEGEADPIVLARMRAHGAPEAEIKKYLDQAENGYLRTSVYGDQVTVQAYGPFGETKPFERRTQDGVEQDPGGLRDYAWRISRSFSRDPHGRLEVHHDYFFIRDDLQGTGVGADVLRAQMQEYRRLGVDTVSVDAADVGKYFWPSIGFDAHPAAVDRAITAYKTWLVRTDRAATAADATAAVKGIRSLPSLAQAEFGKDFLLSVEGPWNLGLKLHLNEKNPLFHLMRGRLDVAAAAVVGLGGALEGSREAADQKDQASDAAGAAALGGLSAFNGRAGLFQAARGKLVRDLARRVFASAGEAAVRTTARLAYSRSQVEHRQAEFASWQADPSQLIQRVASGLRDAPTEAFATLSAGVYATAAFLREKLPANAKPNPVAIRAVPVSSEAAAKYARYEEAALTPQIALAAAGETGFFSPELLETLQQLYPDLLAEVRVASYQQVRSGGPPLSIQAKAQYAALFDGNGAAADPAFGTAVARMAQLAYDQQTAPKPGPTGAGLRPGVSRLAGAVSPPRGLGPVV